MSKKIAGIKLYDTKEIGLLLGISAGTVRLYIREGRLKSRMIGGCHWISEKDLKEFVMKTD